MVRLTHQEYELSDSERKGFPIDIGHYAANKNFTRGIERISVFCGFDGKPCRMYLHGSVRIQGDLMEDYVHIEGEDMKKVLEFLERLEDGQAGEAVESRLPYLMNSALREAVRRGKENPLKPS
ncbi:MAG: hypothetical protein PHH00_01695 [Candidatus Nanoarchaeia archaeon]|nr:hypothetical protein [Candidatus Nanoarchaeia archaeon]